MLAAEWGVGEVLWTMIWFTMFFLWVWLVVGVIADIFRSHDMGGLAKTLWVLFVVFLPWLGVLAYLIARGDKMGQHAAADAQARETATREYVRDMAGTTASPANELSRLADLRAQGVIDDNEFQQLKSKVVLA